MAPPLKATFSALATPPRALSATRALARTDTFMPMKPAAPEKAPPITNPMAVRTSRAMASTMASTTATMPMIWYWRLRYAWAPSCTAFEISCMRSLPGDLDSSQRDVSRP
jgi:hypothetical protein